MFTARWLQCLLVSGGTAWALVCPQVTPANPPAFWVGLPANNFTSFAFFDLERNPRTPGQSLPFTVQTPSSAIGAFDPHTFPEGPPFYSNSSRGERNCLPGIDPSQRGCPLGQVGEACSPEGDCTGKPILRTPATGIESEFSSGITGIDYLGTFDGAADPTAGVAPGGLLQIVFFHQNADYLAQAEYGFYRDVAVPSQLVFYWQTNANCTLHPDMRPNDTMCTTLKGDRRPSTYIYTDDLIPPGISTDITGGCTIDLGPGGGFGLYYYSMWIFSDGGTLKFGMSILDPNTFLPVVPETSIDPNVGASSAWFPISTLYGVGGYVTAGISRYDPFNSQTFPTAAPSMSIQRLRRGW